MRNFFAALLFLAIPVLGFCQKYWEVSLTPGAMVYYGDLTVPDVTMRETHLAGQLNLKRYFDGEHALRVGVLHGTISGDDRNYERLSGRGNRFKGRLTEFSVMGELDLRGRRRFSKRAGYQKTSSPYIMFGFSGVYCEPEVTYGQPDSKDKGIDYPNWHFATPLGAGFRFDANERVVFGVELGLRLTLSDYLDGTQASGNAFKNDAFVFGGVTAGYRFQKRKANPNTP